MSEGEWRKEREKSRRGKKVRKTKGKKRGGGENILASQDGIGKKSERENQLTLKIFFFWRSLCSWCLV